MIALSETWLDSSVLSSEILSNEYQIYRKDRSTLTSSKSRGGGVLVAVKSCYVSSEVYLPVKDIEMICVKLTIWK